MVLNTSTLELENLQGQDYRRHINNLLREAGVCMPGGGMVYIVTERDFEDLDPINDFSERVAAEIDFLCKKILRLWLRMVQISALLAILSYLSLFWPGVVEQHEAVLTILLAKVGPTLVILYLWRELIHGAIYAKWKTIKHGRLEVVRRVNHARRRLPVVASIIADGQMVARTDLLNERCYNIVSLVTHGLVDHRMRSLPFDCAVVILLGVFACTFPIYWFRTFTVL